MKRQKFFIKYKLFHDKNLCEIHAIRRVNQQITAFIQQNMAWLESIDRWIFE